MHAWNDEKLSVRQRTCAAAANDIHRRIQRYLATTCGVDGNPSHAITGDITLRDLYSALGNAEARLWEASRMSVTLIQANANVLVNSLGQATREGQSAIVANIMACAKGVQDSLQCLTDAQAQTMLSMPNVALAYNVAMDCEAEFDNEEAFARWTKMAADIPR